ncbi:MAG: hypothetical protein M1824_002394 [Vezdaea acicularis]|nr:MAG: hypothetical protein M1824_002394 [Vezdaea acicularis]
MASLVVRSQRAVLQRLAPSSSRLNGFARTESTAQLPLAEAAAVKVQVASKPPPTEKYFVSRSKSGNLPVYLQAKRGGNLRQTKIQKIEGDVSILQKQLIEALALSKDQVTINYLTKHIIIKGWKRQEVMDFLGSRNF